MGEIELRNALLELYPENLVDEFLDRVNTANQSAMTRIARAKTVVSTETPVEAEVERTVEAVEEVVEVEEVESVEEVVVEVETVTDVVAVEVEEVVEVEEEEEETVIELDETFVTDLVGSPEFTAALRTAMQPIIEEFKKEIVSRMAVVEETVKAEQEWVQDKPARTKRAVVSYRAQNASTEEVVVEKPVARTYQDIAKENVNKIFGEA